MKIIKLDRRHNLYRKGYVWAFRFEGWDSRASKVENAVNSLEGSGWYRRTFWGKTKKTAYSHRSISPYYIGVKNESTITMVMLKIN